MMRSPRVRITLAFLAATVIALIAVGLVVHAGVRARLTDSLDEVLEDRGTATARLLVERGNARPGLTEGLDDPGESFTQVIGPDGRLRLSTPGLPLRPILDAEQRRRASAGGLDVRLDGIAVDDSEDAEEIDLEALEETGTEPFETDRARVRSATVTLADGTYAIITGSTFEERDEALRELSAGLWIGAPLILALVGVAGYLAVGRALRPLHDALAHERKLVADVSHELRTPLAVISGELELALAAPDREEVDESVRVAAGEARRLTRIGSDLLLLARADRDQLALHEEPLDAVRLLDTTARRFATRGPVDADGAPGLAFRGDRMRLEQALGNLVDNAFTHGARRVDLSAAAADGAVVLCVRDDGPGFPAELLPAAFERFSRGREGRAGLGLAIVAVVAEAHGGGAEARNLPGGGAEVRLRIPVS